MPNSESVHERAHARTNKRQVLLHTPQLITMTEVAVPTLPTCVAQPAVDTPTAGEDSPMATVAKPPTIAMADAPSRLAEPAAAGIAEGGRQAAVGSAAAAAVTGRIATARTMQLVLAAANLYSPNVDVRRLLVGVTGWLLSRAVADRRTAVHLPESRCSDAAEPAKTALAPSASETKTATASATEPAKTLAPTPQPAPDGAAHLDISMGLLLGLVLLAAANCFAAGEEVRPLLLIVVCWILSSQIARFNATSASLDVEENACTSDSPVPDLGHPVAVQLCLALLTLVNLVVPDVLVRLLLLSAIWLLQHLVPAVQRALAPASRPPSA